MINFKLIGKRKNTNRPVVVHVRELEAHSLVVLGFEANRVMNDVKVGRIDGALRSALWDQVEVEPFGSSDHCVDDCTAWGIHQVVALKCEETSAYSLLYHYECHQRSFILYGSSIIFVNNKEILKFYKRHF